MLQEYRNDNACASRSQTINRQVTAAAAANTTATTLNFRLTSLLFWRLHQVGQQVFQKGACGDSWCDESIAKLEDFLKLYTY